MLHTSNLKTVHIKSLRIQHEIIFQMITRRQDAVFSKCKMIMIFFKYHPCMNCLLSKHWFNYNFKMLDIGQLKTSKNSSMKIWFVFVCCSPTPMSWVSDMFVRSQTSSIFRFCMCLSMVRLLQISGCRIKVSWLVTCT